MESPRIANIAGALSAAAFTTQFAWLDLAFRGASAWGREPRLVVGVCETVLLWLLALALAKSRILRAAVALLAATLFVVQAQVFRYYHAPLDIQVAASALHAWADVRPVLAHALPSLAAAIAVAALVEYALASFGVRALPHVRVARPRVLAAAAGAGLFFVPLRTATPDVRGVHALVALGERHEARSGSSRPDAFGAGARSPAALPPLHSARGKLPSVLLILTESVRAEDYGPETAPATAEASRPRTDLRQMRSIASYTALSFSAVLTGRTQLGPRDEIIRAPTLFDFARAVRDDEGRRPTVVYASAHSEEVFETREMRASLDRLSTIETLLGHGPDEGDPREEAGLDALVVDRFVGELGSLPSGPVVAVLHLIDTHAPYAVDPEHAPFQPAEHVPAWSRMGTLHNAYKDAIFAQDRAVARAVRAFVDRAGASPWLVVFTSDHGEAFGEHGAIHHGQNLFDEQVHVPGWIAAGLGTLGGEEARALEDHASRFVTHLDLLPTILDAIGVWDDVVARRHRRAMPGRSLLRAWEPRAPIPVTNCTGMFPCPTNTWGLYAADHKLLARIYDGGWVCFAVGAGPERLAAEADPACEALRTASRAHFPFLPSGAANN